jgi:hypothetical protein
MKKLLILFVLFLSISVFCQERTVDLNYGNLLDLTKVKKLAYNGTTSDRLIPTTRDTIDYYLRIKDYHENGPMHFYANITFDTIAGVDTTVAVTVMGKKFASEDYSDIIASALTDTIDSEVQYIRTTLGVTSEYTETYTFAASTDTFLIDTTSITYALDTYGGDSVAFYKATIENVASTATVSKIVSSNLYYGYLKFRLILQGNDSVGTGIKVKRIEIQFF